MKIRYNTKLVIFFLLLCILSVNVCSGQWIYQNNPDSSKVIMSSSFLNSNTGWLSGYKGRITKTIDGGLTWNTKYIDTVNILSINFLSLNTGYACGTYGKIYKTSNSGLNWNQQNSSVTDSLRSIDFINENTGWCTGKNYILKTTNGGLQWYKQNVDSSVYRPDFFCIKMYDAQNGLAGGRSLRQIQNFGCLFRTTNGGYNWYFVDSFYTYIVSSICFVDQNNAFISTPYMILKSNDGGSSWNFCSNINLPSTFNQIHFKDINTGWLMCLDHFSKTTNGGLNWNTLLGNGYYSRFHYVNENYLYVISKKGIFKSTDGGILWRNYSDDSYVEYRVIKSNSINDGFVVGEYGTVRKSTDGGNTWKQCYRNGLNNLFGLSFLNQYTAYCYDIDGKIIKTTNSGDDWSEQGYADITYILDIFCEDENTVWVVGDSAKVLKSTNSGINWINKAPDSNIEKYYKILGFPNKILLFGDDKLYMTSNSGNNWIQSQLDSINYLQRIFFKDSQTGWNLTPIPNNSRFYKTTDGGNNWTKYYYTGCQNYLIWDIWFVNENTGYATTGTSAILKTTDGGINWFINQIIAGNNIIMSRIIFADENTGWICGWNGIICKTTNGGGTFISKISPKIPEKFSLSQNYPNPFNPFTNIKLEIAHSGFISLRIYDINGKEVSVLVNEKLEPGIYTVYFNGSRLASGIYFYSLESERFRESKK